MTEKLTLSEFQLVIRDSLYMAFPDMYWVVAEISEIKENYAGHCYLELIEKQPDDKDIRARAKAIIWCKRYRLLKSYFGNITGESLKAGLKILVRVKVEYHELYGLSLIICDIDPAFTVGELAMKRQLIIRQLEQEGVFLMNRELGLPFLMQRIAVISSASAAGYTDFMNHLLKNEFGYVFYTKLFESPMQGSDTERGLTGALDRIALNHHLFDVVVIIRGGGSQVDLSWFDNYNIAYHITQFPLPVLTGIGHDKDMSVSDMVACEALKTPTAVAGFIINHTAGIENRLLEMLAELKDLSQLIVKQNSARLENSGIRLFPMSRILISGIRDQLSEKTIRLVSYGGEYLRKAGLIPMGQISRLASGIRLLTTNCFLFLKRSGAFLETESYKILQRKSSDIESIEKNLELLKPENVLRRGYTITYHNGAIQKIKGDLRPGDELCTQFSDGMIRSSVTGESDRGK